MQLGVLVTDNGKHSDEKLAIAVATEIVQIGADASGQQAIDGRRLENQIIDAMETHFAKLAEFEHAELDAKGTAALAASMEPHPELVDASVAAIASAIAASPFASWFTADATAAYVRQVVEKWVTTAQHMHRDWYARHGKIGHGVNLSVCPKHDSECEHVKQWIAA